MAHITDALPIAPLLVVVAIAWIAGIAASPRPSARAARTDILRAISSQ